MKIKLFEITITSLFIVSCISTKPIQESCEQVTSKIFNKKSTILQTNTTWENYYENKNIIWEVKVINVLESRAPIYSSFYEDKYFGSGYVVYMKCSDHNIYGYYPEFLSVGKSYMLKINSNEKYQISGTLKSFNLNTGSTTIYTDISKIIKVR